MTDASGRKTILLMTATIRPPANALELKRTDPAARLQDYRQALSFYLEHVGGVLDGIVFVENSGSDTSALAQLAADAGKAGQVEFVTLPTEPMPAGCGRAYGEFRLLDQGMAKSAMIQSAGDQAIVWKVTGRYKLLNIAHVISRCPKKFDAYFDMKDRPMRWMDLRVMAWTIRGYDRLFRGLCDELGSTVGEVALRDHIPKKIQGIAVVQRFNVEPLVDGIRGVDNQNYARGIKMRAKYWMRNVCRTLLPWLWI